MNVLLASAEMAPIARVGGMAEAVAGLVKQLRQDGVEVTVALPDYGGVVLREERRLALDVPSWAGPAEARIGFLEDGSGRLLRTADSAATTPAAPNGSAIVPATVALIDCPGMAKPHPYNDETGMAFADNDLRFFCFSAGIAALTKRLGPDVLHLNDWHTAAAAGMLTEPPPTLLTIHTLAYQGVAGAEWMERLERAPELFAWYGSTNPLLGGIRLADRVVTVSPHYAGEILSEENGMGLHQHLAELGDRLVGIINGIDAEEWNPGSDSHIPAHFGTANMRGKTANRTELVRAFGLQTDGPTQPVIGMVSRLVEQKGIDLVVEVARFLEHVPARLAILGSGDTALVTALQDLTARYPGRIGFQDGYNAALSHLIFAGADLLLMPSRFEPCGLAQMQAMAYGTIPVVTDVGGLHDTVVDADVNPECGTGFVAKTVDPAGIIDAIHRACRAWGSTRRRSAIRSRGMTMDWSWAGPAKAYQDLYRQIVG